MVDALVIRLGKCPFLRGEKPEARVVSICSAASTTSDDEQRNGSCHHDSSAGHNKHLILFHYNNSGTSLDTDVVMPHSSVKDQYCDLESGVWYETVYPFSTTCEIHWYNFWSVMQLEFQKGDCIAGFALDHCKKGTCPVENEDGTPVFEELLAFPHPPHSENDAMMKGSMNLVFPIIENLRRSS